MHRDSGHISETHANDTGESQGISINVGGVNTLTAWVELTASTSFEYEALYIAMGVENANESHLIDIGIGPAGSEEVLVQQIFLSSRDFDDSSVGGVIRIKVPAGVRLAARAQSSNSGEELLVAVTGMAGGFYSEQGNTFATTYGANAASTHDAQIVDPGSTADTYGAWTEFTASTDHDIKQLVVFVGDNDNSAPASEVMKFQVGIGSSGNEEIVVGDTPVRRSSSGISSIMSWYDLPVFIPAGSRIALRSSSDITNATDRLATYVIIGVG